MFSFVIFKIGDEIFPKTVSKKQASLKHCGRS